MAYYSSYLDSTVRRTPSSLSPQAGEMASQTPPPLPYQFGGGQQASSAALYQFGDTNQADPGAVLQANALADTRAQAMAQQQRRAASRQQAGRWQNKQDPYAGINSGGGWNVGGMSGMSYT